MFYLKNINLFRVVKCLTMLDEKYWSIIGEIVSEPVAEDLRDLIVVVFNLSKVKGVER